MTASIQPSATPFPAPIPRPPSPQINTPPTQSPPSYGELLAQNQALQQSQKNLTFQLAALQDKNDYWTRLYTYVEKGIAIKITELANLKQQNEQLKVHPP